MTATTPRRDTTMTYVMDSSAMIAFPRNETGAATVADLLTDPQNECCAHALNLCEVFYDFARSGGEGEVKNGEGVYGLRRALVLAGSETQVMSLWPVSDKGTRDLMIEYYRRLLRGEGRSAALRAVQLQMLKVKAAADEGEDRLLVAKSQQDKDRILKSKTGRKSGERSAQKDYSHPYYWASFIQSGEWANLQGNR